MIRADAYQRIFDYPPSNVAALLFTDPDEVEKAAESKEVAAWQLLLGAMQLRRAGQRSPANDWLNHATHLNVSDDVFRAELLGEAGQGLFDTDRLHDAASILNSAEAIWRDVCDQATEACNAPTKQAAVEFASHLLPLFAAAKTEPPTSAANLRKGSEAVPIIRQWLAERAVVGRAQTANTFVRLLAKAQQIDDARKVLQEELDWVAVNLTSPARRGTAHELRERLMSRTTRRGLYLLLLAQGEVELAGGESEASADAFGDAAGIYEGAVQDEADISSLLQAKFNQANSLLRLKRIAEATSIYELVEHGFNSIGQPDKAQRVAHAKLFAQTLDDDDD